MRRVRSKFTKHVLVARMLHDMFGGELQLGTTTSGSIVFLDEQGNRVSRRSFDHPEDAMLYLEQVEDRAIKDIFSKQRGLVLSGDVPDMGISQFFDSIKPEVRETTMGMIREEEEVD